MSNVDGAPETVLEKAGLYGCGLVILSTGAVFLYAAITFFSVFVPLWVALLLGIPVGVGALALCFIGETTLMEIAVKCFIMLMLASILIPAFQRAKQNAQKSRTRNQPTQIQGH